MIQPQPTLDAPAPTAERVPGSTKFERLRQRLVNNRDGATFGNIDSGDMAYEIKDMSAEEMTELYKEFGKDPGMAELFQDANQKKEYYAEGGDYNGLSLLNSLNSNLSDMASQDRPDEDMLTKAGRFGAGALHGVTEGLQTAFGLGHDRFSDTPINSGGPLQQAGDLLGLGNAHLARPLLKKGAQMASTQVPTIAKYGKKGLDFVKGMFNGGRGATTSGAKVGGVAKHTINGVDDVAKGGAAAVTKEGVKEGGEQAAKKGLIPGIIKRNPGKSIGAGLIGGAGIANLMDNEPVAETTEEGETDEGIDDGTLANGQSTLGLGTGLNPGELNASNQRDFADNLGTMKPRLGGSGSKMMDLGAARQRAYADTLDMRDIEKDKGTYDPKYSQDPNYFLKQRYESTGNRGAGAWDALDPAKKAEMASNYRANSYYDSSSDAGKAADAKLKESGYTPPMADALSQAEGQEMAEQSRLQELDAAVEAQQSGETGGYGVAANPENYQGSVKSVTKDEFTDKSGMFTPGTGLIGDGKGGYSTLETGDAFEGSGGKKSAEEYLIGTEEQGPIQPQGEKSFGPQQNMPRPMRDPGVEIQGPVAGAGNQGYSQADPLLDPNVGEIQNQQRELSPIENGASLMAQLDNFGPGSGKAPEMTKEGVFTPEKENPFLDDSAASYERPEYANQSGKGMYTDQFGQQSQLSEGSVRMSANDEDYGDNFTSKDDALGYVNRGGRPTIDEPAPAPGPVADPNAIMGPENTADTGLDTLTGLGLGAGVALLMRKFGVPKQVAEKMFKAQRMNVVPQGQLANGTRLLGNKTQPRLGNMPARNTPTPGAAVTPEQFRQAASPAGRAQSSALASQHAAQNAPRVALERSGIPRIGGGRYGRTEAMRKEALRRQREQATLGNTY